MTPYKEDHDEELEVVWWEIQNDWRIGFWEGMSVQPKKHQVNIQNLNY